MATLWNAVSGWMSTDRTPNDVKKASVCTTECVKQLVDDKSWTPLMHWRTGQKDGEIELGEMHCADSRLDIHCDHLFLVFVKIGLVEECALFANMKEGSVKTVWKLGMEVCGHRGLVHGGLSASVMDETLGGCIATLVEGGALPKETGPVVTAHLGVDYCRPLPAGSEIVCTAQLASVEGRKIWLQVDIRDLHDPEVVYVKGKSLFLKIPKDKLMAAQAAPKEQPAQPQQQEQQDQPLEGAQGCGGAVKLPEGGKEERYRTLCSHIGLDADSDLLL